MAAVEASLGLALLSSSPALELAELASTSLVSAVFLVSMSSPKPTGVLLASNPLIVLVVVIIGGLLSSASVLLSSAFSLIDSEEGGAAGGGAAPSPSCLLSPGAGVLTS